VSVLGKLIDRVLSGPDRREIVAQRLYAALTAQARRPVFYASCGVPDTIDGRFEMVALHAFLLFRRLKGHGEKAGARSSRVWAAASSPRVPMSAPTSSARSRREFRKMIRATRR